MNQPKANEARRGATLDPAIGFLLATRCGVRRRVRRCRRGRRTTGRGRSAIVIVFAGELCHWERRARIDIFDFHTHAHREGALILAKFGASTGIKADTLYYPRPNQTAGWHRLNTPYLGNRAGQRYRLIPNKREENHTPQHDQRSALVMTLFEWVPHIKLTPKIMALRELRRSYLNRCCIFSINQGESVGAYLSGQVLKMELSTSAEQTLFRQNTF